MSDADPGFAALWREFAQRVEGLSSLVLGEGTPNGDAQRAAGCATSRVSSPRACGCASRPTTPITRCSRA
jgi:hypothetical protein